MPRILCDADPFCYGPASTLLSITKQLRRLDHSVTILARGTAHELASRASDAQVVLCDTSSVDSVLENMEALGHSDLLLSVLGDASVRAAQALRMPVAYVDVLFWAWPSTSEPHIRDVDLYFVEDHFGASARLASPAYSPRNAVLVGPIIDLDVAPAPSVSPQRLLVSFGGIDFPGTRKAEYPGIVMQLLAGALSASPAFPEVLVAGGSRAMGELQLAYPLERVIYESCSHDRFLASLAGSRLLLTQPGIATPLEAFAYGVPTVFMPPMNYTQVLQLRHFRAAGVAPYAVDWECLDPDWAIPTALGEAEGVAEVLARVERLRTDRRWQEGLQRRLSGYLALSADRLEALRTLQASFLHSLAKGGARTVADTIDSYLRRVSA